MKVLLTAINAKYIHSCLAVYSLKANASEYKELIQIKEFTINNRVEDILREIYETKPDILTFSCYIWNIEYVKRLAREASKLMPEISIWLGGPEVSYNAVRIMKEYKMIKGIIIAEGENTFYQLLKYYADKNIQLSDIQGITYRDDEGNIIENDFREPMDLNALEFAYADLKEFENRIIYYESSRGCPFSCSYCLSSIDKKLRLKETGKVKRELSFFLKEKVKQVKFVDRTFNASKEYAMEIWHYLLEEDNGITNFHFEIAADLLDDEQIMLLSRMRKGLVQFEIGVQSVNEDTIQEIDRTMNLNKLREAVRKIKSGGNIHQHLDLIAGLPFENYESFHKSFNEVYSMHPDQLQLGFLKVLHGSKMHDNIEKYGLVYGEQAPYEVLCTNWISYEEMCRLKDIEEAVEMYYNSGQFTNTIRCLERKFTDSFSVYEKISAFLNREDRFKKHSRINNYLLLLEFIKTMNLENEDIYEELLTHDLYLRENMKTRPGFATDLTPYKERIKSFYSGRINCMMHVEVYKRDIILYIEKEIDNGKQTYVSYDYHHKDPLTNQAETEVIYEEECERNT